MGGFNSLYFTLVLISRAPALHASAYRPHIHAVARSQEAASRVQKREGAGVGGGASARVQKRGEDEIEEEKTVMVEVEEEEESRPLDLYEERAAIKRKAYYTLPRNKISALISFQQSAAGRGTGGRGGAALIFAIKRPGWLSRAK